MDALPARAAGLPAGIARPAAQQPALSDVVLAPSGELHLTTNRPAGGGRSDQEKATISAGDAEALLSDMGRKMLGQLQAAESPAPAAAAASALRHVNCDLVPCAALTYDDDPDARTTPQLLAILKEKNVHATFS